MRLLGCQYNQVSMRTTVSDLSHCILRSDRKFRDRDHGIYCLRTLYFCHNLSWLHILVYSRCMDHRSIRVDIYKNQLRYVLYKWHSPHKAMDCKASSGLRSVQLKTWNSRISIGNDMDMEMYKKNLLCCINEQPANGSPV